MSETKTNWMVPIIAGIVLILALTNPSYDYHHKRVRKVVKMELVREMNKEWGDGFIRFIGDLTGSYDAGINAGMKRFDAGFSRTSLLLMSFGSFEGSLCSIGILGIVIVMP